MIDCHVHVFAPDRFPYAADTWYRPAGGKTGTATNGPREIAELTLGLVGFLKYFPDRLSKGLTGLNFQETGQ